MAEPEKTFWEHLDDLRGLLIRIVAVVSALSVICFCFKDELFGIVMAPSHPDFVLYRVLGGLIPPSIEGGLINTSLSGQLMMHFKVALGAGVCLSAPVVIFMVARYLSPALYAQERRAMTAVFVWGGLLFAVGAAVAYVLIFPLAYQFLMTYQVSPDVQNMINLQSYIDNLLLLCLLMGVLFELPVVARVLSALGLLTRGVMRRYRRHALLAIVTLSAIVTPTTDVLTLALVSLPVWLLYEASILVVRK
ncbi:MAG: twin-arginine translocase subunit TatC [Bacteroidales bacterium]|nr:twin-arginine translocase subunit TatC [Bacteroidales bacterium]